VISKNDIVRTEVLKTYFDILFYKDLVERYKIDNEKAIRFLIKKLIL
jgi:predicted AAA+ superfamily ATPase